MNEQVNEETGKANYEELVFNIPESEIENYDIKLEGKAYKDVIKGDWSIKLKEPTELETKELGKVQIENNIELSEITLSGLSLSLDYDAKILKEELPMEIKIVKKDGTEQNISNESVLLFPSFQGNSNGGIIGWTTAFNYIPLDTIDKVIINDKTIDVK